MQKHSQSLAVFADYSRIPEFAVRKVDLELVNEIIVTYLLIFHTADERKSPVD